MDIIRPRSSMDHVPNGPYLNKCVVQPSAGKIHLPGTDVERLEKIKVTLPPMETASLQLCMRGHRTAVDILNLSVKPQDARLYLTSAGQLFIAKTVSTAPQDVSEQARRNSSRFGTKRSLQLIPSSQNPQTVVISDKPSKVDETAGIRRAALANCISGSSQAVAAGSSLALSAGSFSFAAGATGLSIGQCLIAFGGAMRGAPSQPFLIGLHQLGVGATELQGKALQTALDTFRLGCSLSQFILGAGQYAYASSKSVGAQDKGAVNVTLAQRPPEAPATRSKSESSLTIHFQEPDVQNMLQSTDEPVQPTSERVNPMGPPAFLTASKFPES